MNVECRIPDSESEHWKIESFEVKEDDLGRVLHALRNPGRACPAGHYTRLVVKGWANDIMMSNTPAEVSDHRYFIKNAKGHVLINGLGLGIVLEMLLENENVMKITVIEKDDEIMELVAPHFEKEKKIEIIHDDAFTYKSPKGIKYDAVWHDIWLNITSDNLPEMTKLHRKYAKKTDWQDSWCKEECKRNY